MACVGHGRGGHKGAPKAKKAKKARESCSVKLKRQEKNIRAANKYLKSIFGKKK